ncbi:hypothetical protein AVEN_22205-1, partial [Araneus ventricosus]
MFGTFLQIDVISFVTADLQHGLYS